LIVKTRPMQCHICATMQDRTISGLLTNKLRLVGSTSVGWEARDLLFLGSAYKGGGLSSPCCSEFDLVTESSIYAKARYVGITRISY